MLCNLQDRSECCLFTERFQRLVRPAQGAMAKGRASRKEPDAWDTACQITNTVLEVAKVSLRARKMQPDVCTEADSTQKVSHGELVARLT